MLRQSGGMLTTNAQISGIVQMIIIIPLTRNFIFSFAISTQITTTINKFTVPVPYTINRHIGPPLLVKKDHTHDKSSYRSFGHFPPITTRSNIHQPMRIVHLSFAFNTNEIKLRNAFISCALSRATQPNKMYFCMQHTFDTAISLHCNISSK